MVAVHAPAPRAATASVRRVLLPGAPGGLDKARSHALHHLPPSDGYYSSNDPTIIKQQIASMQNT